MFYALQAIVHPWKTTADRWTRPSKQQSPNSRTAVTLSKWFFFCSDCSFTSHKRLALGVSERKKSGSFQPVLPFLGCRDDRTWPMIRPIGSQRRLGLKKGPKGWESTVSVANLMPDSIDMSPVAGESGVELQVVGNTPSFRSVFFWGVGRHM